MQDRTFLYVGTYTDPIKFGTGNIFEGKGEGIYLVELDLQTGNLKIIDIFKNISNPSYLVVNKENSYLYAVNELKEFRGKPSGAVSSFKISKTNGKLTFINIQPTNGTDPCHIELNKENTILFVTNYMSGSVSVFPINPDGSIGELCQFIQHIGNSVNPARQSGPHAHSLVFSPDGKFAFVQDLGLDKVMVYQTKDKTQPFVEAAQPYFQTQPGAGPRHGTFGNSGDFYYLINELDSTILALSYNAEAGSFTELQRVSSLPEGIVFPGNSCADIHISPDGAYLYGSNRGHNSLVIYKIDQQSSLLAYVTSQSCGGLEPRNFMIDPSGNYLLCANQNSDDITAFKIDKQNGWLKEVTKLNIPTPVCIKSVVL